MPFTPFHFGPAVLLKAALPAGFSAAAFAGAQVAVDTEVLWHMIRQQHPVHGVLHSIICAAALGLAVGVSVHFIGRRLSAATHSGSGRMVCAEWSWTGVLLGGGLGGVTHAMMDAIMYRDMDPFWPLISGNPFQGILAGGTVQLGCVVLGVVGAFWLLCRLYLDAVAG